MFLMSNLGTFGSSYRCRKRSSILHYLSERHIGRMNQFAFVDKMASELIVIAADKVCAQSEKWLPDIDEYVNKQLKIIGAISINRTTFIHAKYSVAEFILNRINNSVSAVEPIAVAKEVLERYLFDMQETVSDHLQLELAVRVIDANVSYVFAKEWNHTISDSEYNPESE